MASSSSAGNTLSREEMDSRGITRIRNGKEIIVKDGVEYEQTSGLGYGSDFARTDGYGMSGNGEKPTLDKIFGGNMDGASYDVIDSMSFGSSKAGAQEKYAQLRDVANGKVYGTSFTPADVLQRSNPGSEYMYYNRKGKPEGWKSERLNDRVSHYGNGSVGHGANYHDGRMQLIHDLGPSAEGSIKSSLQRQAAKWLKDNPDRSGQKGWRFNGKKWVETGRR